MTAFQRILYPVDSSEQCQRAAPFVKAFADRFHAEIIFLHVIEPTLPLGGMPETAASSLMFSPDEERATDQAELDKFAAGFGGENVHLEMADGDPALQIGCYAKKNKVDLIMIPTHGYGSFRQLLLGSVTAKVLHDVDCPVWTSAHTPEPALHPPDRCRRIVCAVDTNPGDTQVIRWAGEFAKQQGAEVQLVHAIQAGSPDQFDSAAFYSFLTRFAQEELERMQAEAGTTFKVSVPSGTPAEVVRASAKE